MEIKPIAHIESEFTEKFGIPRQSGLVKELTAQIVFEPEYRRMEALKELDGFSHIWLIWQFSETMVSAFRPTVRPPRLGGNRRVGVFASRAPYRPNGLGLSCVKLVSIADSARGPIITVSGADLLSGTPIFDIKPYVPLSDCHADALPGYTAETREHRLTVEISDEMLCKIPQSKREGLRGVLACDPRPGYEDDPQTVYGLAFGGMDIGFCVQNGVCRVVRVNLKEEK